MIFAKSQVITPAGIATTTALLKTNNVLSISEVYMIRPICGTLYGGSSNVKVELSPLRSVFENK